MAQDGMIVLPQMNSPDLSKYKHEAAWDSERLSDNTGMSPLEAAAACSDTSSGPVPTISTTDGTNITIVPVANLNSASLAAAAAVAEQQQQQAHLHEHMLEALRTRRRLLFTQAPPECTAELLTSWCSQYGAVEQVQIHNEPANVLGSSCGIITMASSEAASATLAALHSSTQLPAPLSKLSVTWVSHVDDPANSTDGVTSSSSLVTNAGKTIFFAKVPPTALASEMELLFGSFGKLAEVNLFRAWAGAKHSKGCGLVTYVNRNSAAAAIAQLHGKYIFPGSDCPMVVEWMDLKKQRPVAAMPVVDKPPMGCACDAFKLLLSNIPVGVTEDALITALSHFGSVVQLGLAPDVAGPCASGYVWYATKHAADALLNRSKAEPVWLRDPRSGHDLALSVKKARRPGHSNSSSTTTSRVSVGMPGFHGGAGMSSSTNSSSSTYLPVLHLASLQAAAHGHDSYSNSARLAAAAAGVVNSNSLDALGLLANADSMRLLPMQQVSSGLLGASAPAMRQASAAGNPLAHDVCEAMLDYCDSVGLSMGMPVHLQPAMAAQMAARMTGSLPSLQQQQQRQLAQSQMCCLPTGVVTHGSGQHCLSSPANIQPVDEFEGSFNMPTLRTSSLTLMGGSRVSAGMQTATPTQQLVAVQQADGSVMWQQQPQQQQHVMQLQQQPQQPQQVLLIPQQLQQHQVQQFQQHQVQQLQQQQVQQLQQQQVQQVVNLATASNSNAASSGGGAFKSIAVPINGYEVQLIAEHLSFFAQQSGASVTITSLPGAGLAVMVAGGADQVALAQSLLATARGQC